MPSRIVHVLCLDRVVIFAVVGDESGAVAAIGRVAERVLECFRDEVSYRDKVREYQVGAILALDWPQQFFAALVDRCRMNELWRNLKDDPSKRW